MRSVLVTGGTGTFGKAFVNDALKYQTWGRVVVYSRDELKQSEMAARFGDERLRMMIGDVRDAKRLKLACRDVTAVVHAAALKQIPACELHPTECLQTNVLGTQAVIEACLAAEVERAVFLSTDKAANPNTHYGACKLAAERLWTRANVYAAGTRTRFSATRYGNVLGSRGSVVDVWRALPEGAEPSVTDPAMTRFWMTIADAVSLVRLALREMRGGEVFVPKCRASSVVELLDAVTGEPARFWASGIRRNEKLHETLITADEARYAYEYADHYRIEPDRTWEEAETIYGAPPVPDGFELRSDTAERLTVAQLRRMIG